MRTLRPPGSSTPLDRLFFGCVGRNSRAWRVSIRSYSTIRHRDAQMQADLAFVRARETLVTAPTECVN